MEYSFGDALDFYSGSDFIGIIEESSRSLERMPFRINQRLQLRNFLQGYQGINNLAIYSFVRRN